MRKLVLLWSGLAAAAVIDRTAVAVGSDVITETEIREEIRVVSFLNRQPLDFSPQSRRRAADRLVDQYLIRQEMRMALYEPPRPERAEPMLQNLKETRFGSEEEYRAALERYGITEQQLKEHLLWQLTALRFTDLRFRAGLPERAQDLLERLKEEAEADRTAPGTPPPAPAPPPPAPEQAPLSVDEQLERWLQQARGRTRIVYMKEAFQ